MTEKRTLAQDEPTGGKSHRNSQGMKRRKLLHDGIQSQSPKQAPTKHGEKHKKSKAQGLKPTSVKGADGSQLVITPSKTSQELVSQGEQRHSPSAKWSLSRCRSGRFLNLDPVFTTDGRYAILATDDEAQVFSIATSCVARTLPTHDTERLTALKLSPKNSERLFASTLSGSIIQWNWESGVEIQTWKKSSPIIAIDLQAADDSSSDDSALLFTLCDKEKGHREISINLDSSGRNKWRTTVVLETSTPLSDLKVIAGGKIIVAWAGDRLLVGNTATPLTTSSFGSAKYVWREVKLPVCATCLDIRFTPASGKQSAKSSARASNLGKLDVALGESGGSILMYYDILNRLLQRENGETENNLVSNRLHWHRKAVKAVKWSRDGNYIISGGLETVLVLWQIDTGRKQFLPHLSSPICNLVVSPAGTSYGIKLGDNSVMVLSTAELRPLANISGLQLPFREDILGRQAETKGSKTKSTAVGNVSDRVPALLHPVHPDRLLLAVPSAQLLSSMAATPSASVLQSFDLRSGQHISRQALTRTNVSVLGSGPQGTELTTPDINFVKISATGDWLATVDEWQQYPEDSDVLHPDAEADSSSAARELFLKFWHWDEVGKEWQLVTRIDAPHFTPACGSERVLGLAVQPEDLGFATIGGDCVVRFWTPEYRQRNSRKNSDTRQRNVRTWQCSQTVTLLKQTGISKPAAACLDFSNDGSILAVCWPGTSQNDPNVVHLIDPATGSIRCTKDGLFAGVPRGIGFINRYLTILSDRLVVWDIVSDEVKYTLAIEDKYVDSLLAVNPSNQTFAISFANHTETRIRGNPEHQFAIFEPTLAQSVFQSSMKHAVRALLPDVRSGEYVVIDAAAQVMRVGAGDKMQPLSVPIVSALAAPTGLENLFGGYKVGMDVSGVVDQNEQAKEVFGASSLATIFDSAPSFALPAVDVLFRNVVDVFSGVSANA